MDTTAQAFCEVRNTDPEQHQKWLAKHGFKPGDDGTFPIDTFVGKEAVTADVLLKNIRINVSANWYEPLYMEPYDHRTFVMICGGPSLADHLDEIREKTANKEKYLVVCSNMTAGYLLENGIVPHVHFILDPQEKKKFDVAPNRTSNQTQYWINAACHPAVFQQLREQGIKPYVFLADFDKDGLAMKAVKESLAPGQPGMMVIQGGTMAGLRAINLADAIGARNMEYYGFDATVKVSDGKARPYAYEKKRGEAIIEVACDRCEERFDTTLIFQKQVNEFLEWQANMPWMNIKIIGGGLIAHYKEHVDAAKPKYGTLRYTQQYAELQKSLHGNGDYGVSGQQYIPTIFHAISQLAKRHGHVDVLDYGSSSGNTMKAVREHLIVPDCVKDHCYDPFVDEFSGEPEAADLVICTDVMEHVEPECTMAVLDHITKLTKRIAFFSISLVPANKFLDDGRNAHINLRDAEFWLKQIKRRFIISEAKVSGDGEVVLCVGQAIADVDQTIRKRNG